MHITTSQSGAIAHGTGPAIVLAGPGSGKTLVITNRIKHLIENGYARPEEILVITFTKAAAIEMKERFSMLMKRSDLRVSFGTFHAVFFQILKAAYRYTASNILKEETRYQILSALVNRHRLEYEDEKEIISDLSAQISQVKNEQIPLEHFYATVCGESIFRDIYREYQKILQEKGLIDFDDMLVYCYQLFSERKDILAAWQKRFRFILVDEFQDINQLQYEVVKMLAGQEQNLFVVGDDDQSIYRFRGAKPEIMLGFQKDFPKAAVLHLNENFRSTGNILEASALVIRENKTRFQKKITCMRDNGNAVEIRRFTGQDKQAEYMIRLIQSGAESGKDYSTYAILTRTNVGGRYLAEKLMEYSIPFRMKDHLPNIYEHWIAKDIFAYIRLAVGPMTRKDFLQVMNRPKRYISRECVDTQIVSFQRLDAWYDDKVWMQQRLDKLQQDLSMLSRMRPFAAVNFIRFGLEYEDYIREYAQTKKIKEEDLLEILGELQENAKAFGSFQEWSDHIVKYTQAMEEMQKENAENKNSVILSTMHSCKGLEFEEVFLPDLNEDVMPHKKASQESELEEERRLLYVGMTRAKEKLHLYYVKERYGKKCEPSRFLEVFELEE